MSKRRNRLAPARAEKLIYIYFNRRSLVQAEHRMGPGVTEAKLASWAKLLDARDGFKWPSTADGAHPSHGTTTTTRTTLSTACLAIRWTRRRRVARTRRPPTSKPRPPPSSPSSPTTSKARARALRCFPARRACRTTSSSGGRWRCGSERATTRGTWAIWIELVNKRRTKQDNVTAEFCDETYGKTWGHWCASTDNYGADRKLVLLKPIPIELDDEEESDTASPAAASGSKS